MGSAWHSLVGPVSNNKVNVQCADNELLITRGHQWMLQHSTLVMMISVYHPASQSQRFICNCFVSLPSCLLSFYCTVLSILLFFSCSTWLSGTAAIQIAKQIGAKIFTTAGSQEKLDFARELGADILINYKEESFVEVVQKETQGPEIKVRFELDEGQRGGRGGV